MYFALSAAVKDTFIQELRRFWATHPRYRDIVDSIQGKYSFEARPHYGIIVKTGSANRVDLSADNFIGTVESYVCLTKAVGYAGHTIEWIREDARAIQDNGGRFPTPPGVYFIEVDTDANENPEFWVHPLLDTSHEQVALVGLDGAQLANSFIEGTLRLYEMPSGFLLEPEVNYWAEPETGTIRLAQSLGTSGRTLSADYRTQGEVVGPYKLEPLHTNVQAIPGCVLAFGDRWEKGDRMAVIVQDRRKAAYLEYGGSWELSLDFDVLSADVGVQQRIADMTVIYIWGILRSRLIDRGMEIIDLSMGGESEEVRDETGDDYFYNSAFSLTVRTDWRIHVPLGPTMRTVSPLTIEAQRLAASLSDEDVAKLSNDIAAMASLGLESVEDPFFAGHMGTFEAIK